MMLAMSLSASAREGVLQHWSFETLKTDLAEEGWTVSECWGESGAGACTAVRGGDSAEIFLLEGPISDPEAPYTMEEGSRTVSVDAVNGARLETLRERFVPEGARIAELTASTVEAALAAEGWQPEHRILDFSAHHKGRIQVDARASTPTRAELLPVLAQAPARADEAALTTLLDARGWQVDSVQIAPATPDDVESIKVFLTFNSPEGTLRLDWFSYLGEPGAATTHSATLFQRKAEQGSLSVDGQEYASFVVQGWDAAESRKMLEMLR